MKEVDIIALGVGAGATAVYDGAASSAFLLRVEGKPVLLLDVGLGVVREALNVAGHLPDHVYISHNHTDHAGELPVMLAVEAQKGRRLSVMAEPTVLNTLINHRLHELQSTGRQLSEFGCFTGCPAGQLHDMGGGLGLLPLKARHAERCFGLLLYYNGQPVLGWSADSGYDAALYSALSAAPVLLLDGRRKGTSEHAGFAQIAAAQASGLFRSSKVFVYGYGTQQDALPPAQCSSIQCIRPGATLKLASADAQSAAEPAAAAAAAAAAVHIATAHYPNADAGTAAAAAVAAAAAAAEATAASSAAAVATAAAMGAGITGGLGGAAAIAAAHLDVAMQDAAQHTAGQTTGLLTGHVGATATNAYNTFGHTGCEDACGLTVGDAAPGVVMGANGSVGSVGAACLCGEEQDLDHRNFGAHVGAVAAAAAGGTRASARAGACVAGYPGVLQPRQCIPHQQLLQQQNQQYARVDLQAVGYGTNLHGQQQLEQQAGWRRHGTGPADRQRHSCVSTATSTSTSTFV